MYCLELAQHTQPSMTSSDAAMICSGLKERREVSPYERFDEKTGTQGPILRVSPMRTSEIKSGVRISY